jgi:hypothetical protein
MTGTFNLSAYRTVRIQRKTLFESDQIFQQTIYILNSGTLLIVV